MEEIRAMIAELEGLMGKESAEDERRRNEIALWVKEHRTPEVEREWNDFMSKGLLDIEKAIGDIRHQLKNHYDLIPLSYVANRYFGKSQSWLSQRINGYEVRGKVYTLNNEQKATFNAAMQDLSRLFGSIRIS